ncbi:hypothetical protein [Bartonella rattaustraliani]|uniref:hypothetical protein n=1 Tax=Bartonella rattaustraliani TaxID=481139 RepID=UPI001FCB2DE0|nr:hypothetical protein [Bartonella rattaustraliani]
MMSNLHSGYRSNLKYWMACIIGFIAILVIIVVGSFYVAKPYLNSFVKREVARRSIKAETSEISLTGKVNLKNVTLPVPTGTSLKIGAISARPPIFFIPGIFTLYNVDLVYGDIHVQIPKISLNSVFLKEKNRAITSQLLQSIMRIELASIVAPNIRVFVENKGELKIKDFQLSHFKNAHIGSVGIKNMALKTIEKNNAKQMNIVTKSNMIEAHDIDINYIYSMILGKNNPVNQEKTVIGPISLKKVMIDLFEGKEKSTSFSLGALKTSGFKVKTSEQIPGKLIKNYLNTRKINHLESQKKSRYDVLVDTLSTITLADAEMSDLNVETPQFQAAFESFQFKQGLWKHPLPQKFLISFNNLSILPKKMEEKDLELFKKMGFERLDLSEKIDFSYDEKKHVLFYTGSFNIKNIASGKMVAKTVDVDEKLFSAEKDAMIAALQDSGITEIDIHYTDSGFIDKLFSYLAQNLNDKKHDLKKELYDDFYLMMTQSPKIFLKNHAEAEKISKSLGDFAKNPQTLMIKMKAKDNKGLTIADLESALQNDLSTVLNKVHLTIKNEASP